MELLFLREAPHMRSQTSTRGPGQRGLLLRMKKNRSWLGCTAILLQEYLFQPNPNRFSPCQSNINCITRSQKEWKAKMKYC